MEMQSRLLGKVYFVGAGPSDAGLITVKGMQVLKKAQAVVYDALIGAGILSQVPQEAEKILAGKRAGKHFMEQEDINRLLLDKALEGKLVVRLKGGDPFLFGRGGEELELLQKNHIPYEIVPGVTSAIAAPAYAGIPVTHRGMSSSVHILTGHKDKDGPLDIDFEALVRAGGTYVILMGISSMHRIVHGFLQAGMPADTPAAIVQEGTGAGQQEVAAPLGALEEEAHKMGVRPPAVIVIGQVAALGKRFAWRGALPLFGIRIFVTRPAARSRELACALGDLGAEVLEIPAIRTKIRDCGEQLSEILLNSGQYGYIVFTSPSGVSYFFELLRLLDLDIRCIGTAKLAVIGSATGQALRRHGLKPDLMPKQYNGIALGKLIRESMQEGGQALILRSSIGNPDLVNEICLGGNIEVTDFAIYDTFGAAQGGCLDVKALIESGQPQMAMFTSASTVRGFVKMAKGLDCTKVQAVCIGKVTAGQAAEYGMQVHIAEQETVGAMVSAAVTLCQKMRQSQFS